MPGCERTSVV